MRNLLLFFAVSLVVSCNQGKSTGVLDSEICYYELEFANLTEDQYEQLSKVSMEIHANYFMYKNLAVMPLRFDNNIFLSLDCVQGVKALELDDWMQKFIEDFSKIDGISSTKYEAMFEQATDGRIVVD